MDHLEYVVKPLDIGNPPFGKLALSYVDMAYGAYGVGSRQVLSDDLQTTHECESAYMTFEKIVAKYKPNLQFGMANPCVYTSKLFENHPSQIIALAGPKSMRLP